MQTLIERASKFRLPVSEASLQELHKHTMHLEKDNACPSIHDIDRQLLGAFMHINYMAGAIALRSGLRTDVSRAVVNTVLSEIALEDSNVGKKDAAAVELYKTLCALDDSEQSPQTAQIWLALAIELKDFPMIESILGCARYHIDYIDEADDTWHLIKNRAAQELDSKSHDINFSDPDLMLASS